MAFAVTLDKLHRTLARSALAVRFVRKLRNQCARIIQCHLGPSTTAGRNGEALLIRQLSPDLGLVFDVGANKGDWSRLVRDGNAAATIYLFECNPQLLDRLRRDFGPDEAARVHGCALGEEEGRRIFYAVQASSELGSLVRPDARESISATEEVAVRTVDGLCTELGIERIDLLKVDTEGYDFHVLKGAARMIAAQKIPVIQFEYGAGWARAGSTLLHCIEWLAQQGYRTYLLTAKGPQTFNYADWGEFLGYANFVALSPAAVLPRK